VPSLLPDAPDTTHKRIAKQQGKHFKVMYLDDVRAFPGASALVAATHHTGRKVVLASSAKENELQHYIDLLGISQFLADKSSVNDVATSSPNPISSASRLRRLCNDPGTGVAGTSRGAHFGHRECAGALSCADIRRACAVTGR
jgi:membrane protein